MQAHRVDRSLDVVTPEVAFALIHFQLTSFFVYPSFYLSSCQLTCR